MLCILIYVNATYAFAMRILLFGIRGLWRPRSLYTLVIPRCYYFMQLVLAFYNRRICRP
ncbi:hypothetical protein V1504DRAFT_452532 [Lipomyces starkeyi]